jgi:hypothetical protein
MESGAPLLHIDPAHVRGHCGVPAQPDEARRLRPRRLTRTTRSRCCTRPRPAVCANSTGSRPGACARRLGRSASSQSGTSSRVSSTATARARAVIAACALAAVPLALSGEAPRFHHADERCTLTIAMDINQLFASPSTSGERPHGGVLPCGSRRREERRPLEGLRARENRGVSLSTPPGRGLSAGSRGAWLNCAKRQAWRCRQLSR